MATQVTQTVQEGRHLLDYIRVLLKRLWLIVGIFIVVLSAFGCLTLFFAPALFSSAQSLHAPVVLFHFLGRPQSWPGQATPTGSRAGPAKLSFGAEDEISVPERKSIRANP